MIEWAIALVVGAVVGVVLAYLAAWWWDGKPARRRRAAEMRATAEAANHRAQVAPTVQRASRCCELGLNDATVDAVLGEAFRHAERGRR